MPQYTGRRLRANVDWILVGAVVALALIGLLNLRSASLMTDASAHVTQLVWFLLGGVVCALVTAVDYRALDRAAWFVYAAVNALLAVVLLVGKEVKGSQRWIEIAGLTIQPSELSKIALILVLARFFSRTRRPEGYRLRDLGPPAAAVALPMMLIIPEPDLGTALMLLFIFLTLLFLENLRRRTVVVLVVLMLAAAPAMWHFGLADYQRERIETLLQPEKDRFGSGWQARQSQIAVGSGGLSGKGYMGSTQSFGRFLPETRTDFVLATFAEEHGFLGCTLLMGLYFFVITWAAQIAYHARDRLGATLAVGVAAMLFWHVLVNVGMVIGVLPVVGVTLPLMSRGGSSVLVVLIGVGLLLSVSMRRHAYQ